MPRGEAPDRNEKHYGGLAKAGTDNPQTSVRVTPANPRRIFLMIQNTGANSGLVRLEEPIQGDGSDMLFTTGSGLVFDRETTCPQGAINIGSAAGTTFCIVEGVRKEGFAL